MFHIAKQKQKHLDKDLQIKAKTLGQRQIQGKIQRQTQIQRHECIAPLATDLQARMVGR